MEEKSWDYREAYGSKDQLHAIGAFITAWNNVELAMFRMLYTLLQITPEKFSPIFSDQSNSARLKLLRLLASEKEHPAVSERVDTFCKFANICVGNRNLIAHAMIKNKEGKVIANKIASSTQLYTKYEFSLEQIQNAADETRAVYGFGINLYGFMNFGLQIKDISQGAQRVRAERPGTVKGNIILKTVSTLPEAPTQPAALTHPPRKSNELKSKKSQT